MGSGGQTETIGSGGGSFGGYAPGGSTPYESMMRDHLLGQLSDTKERTDTAQCTGTPGGEADATSGPSGNNFGESVAGIDLNDWRFAQEVSSGNSATVDSPCGIAIQTGAIAGPLPTDQFGYSVIQRPLASNGTYEPISAPVDWGVPKLYSSGLVGYGITHTMVFSAMPGPGGNRWFIEFPSQERAHGNAGNEYLDIYVPRRK